MPSVSGARPALARTGSVRMARWRTRAARPSAASFMLDSMAEPTAAPAVCFGSSEMRHSSAPAGRWSSVPGKW